MAARHKPHVVVRSISPNQSSRGGRRPTIIVVHATAGHNRPGIADLQALGSWFGSTASAVSSHVATDNEGNSARFVDDDRKAWHCAAYNGISLGIEQVLPGDGTEITERLYQETSRWLARWSHLHAIPLRKGRVSSDGRVLETGVLRHSDLGVLGGNHNDPGPFNLHHCLELARGHRSHL